MKDRKIGFNNVEPKDEATVQTNKVVAFNFSEVEVPKFIVAKNKSYVLNGANHSYPNFLIDLLSKSPMHNSIVHGKAKMVAGEGFAVDEVNSENLNDTVKTKVEQWLNKINKKESANKVLGKVTLDLTVFGYAFLNIVWSKDRKTIAEVYHLPAQNIATGKEDKETGEIMEYYLSNDWTQIRKEENKEIAVPAFNSEMRKGNQIFMIKYDSINNRYYSTPLYLPGITAMIMDYDIMTYHHSNIKNGMCPSMAISYNDGVPTPEEQEKIYDELVRVYRGETNTGKLMLSFSKSKDNAPEFQVLNPNDADKQFLMLNETVRNQILYSHKVTSPILFGIATPGALGQRSELMQASELFYNDVIAPDQLLIEEVFTKFIEINFGEGIKLIIKDSQPISFQFDDATLVSSNILTKTELRQKIGYDPIEEENNKPVALIEKVGIGGTQALLSILTSTLAPEQKINSLVVLFGLSIEEAQSLVGNPPQPENNSINDQFKN